MTYSKSIKNNFYKYIVEGVLTSIVYDFHLPYIVGDILELWECVPNSSKTTGAHCLATITCIVSENVLLRGKVSKIAFLSVTEIKPIESDKEYKKARRGGA